MKFKRTLGYRWAMNNKIANYTTLRRKGKAEVFFSSVFCDGCERVLDLLTSPAASLISGMNFIDPKTRGNCS